jgi:TRAP-type C4-dicarboxylate transport system substrate-binding protein
MKSIKFMLPLLVIASILSAKTVTIKFATLAPEGSTWMNVMREFADEVKAQTNGEVKIKIYAGGVQGDEKDVIRKMRINQLQSGGFTGVGLGTILPEVRILDTPFLFDSHEEIDYVKQKFFDRFSEGFDKKGYVLLGWAEVGFVYIYSNYPLRKKDDLKKVKMWMWEGDPLAKALYKTAGISPIPLSITDVLTSLQTGLIDGVYTSPLACLGLQWFTKVKYMLDVPLANSMGAVLVTKRAFKKISPENQKILRELGKKYFDELTRLSRIDNEKSTEEMLKNGLQKTEVENKQTMDEFIALGEKSRKELVGELYDQELLDQIEAAVKEYRSTHKNK